MWQKKLALHITNTAKKMKIWLNVKKTWNWKFKHTEEKNMKIEGIGASVCMER